MISDKQQYQKSLWSIDCVLHELSQYLNNFASDSFKEHSLQHLNSLLYQTL